MSIQTRLHFTDLRYTVIVLILVWSCEKRTGHEIGEFRDTIGGPRQPNSSIEQLKSPLDTSDSAQDSISMRRYGFYKIEEVVRGKNDSNFWKTGLTEIKYRIYERDTLLTTVAIEPSDFGNLYNKGFWDGAKIWNSEILLVDTTRGKIVISNRFGLPESDNETYVLCVSDFRGNKAFMDSPFASSSGTNISFNKIVNCNGVYDFTEPLLEFTSCCTVFSDLVNERTLFYVIDWQDEAHEGADNAFLIDIISKDTLESFVFNHFSYELGYTALIAKSRQLGILALVNYDRKELVTWDTMLNKETFDLTKIESVEGINSGPNTIEMYCFPPGEVFIQFDEGLKPETWHK
jgi:hypothetical protein